MILASRLRVWARTYSALRSWGCVTRWLNGVKNAGVSLELAPLGGTSGYWSCLPNRLGGGRVALANRGVGGISNGGSS
jgi:hypothetical protein